MERRGRAVGLELRDTKVVIFGSPPRRDAGHVGGAARGARPAAKGPRLGRRRQTKLSYDWPHELAARYRLSDELAGRLSAIDAVTGAVIEQ
jgi:hypothetical protein